MEECCLTITCDLSLKELLERRAEKERLTLEEEAGYFLEKGLYAQERQQRQKEAGNEG